MSFNIRSFKRLYPVILTQEWRDGLSDIWISPDHVVALELSTLFPGPNVTRVTMAGQYSFYTAGLPADIYNTLKHGGEV